MNLAIFHYHLNRGGVTRVIANQLAALDAALEPERPIRAAIVFGGRKEDWNEDLPGRLKAIRTELHAVPGLEYDNVRDEESGRQSEDLHRELIDLLNRLDFQPSQTVLHFHNHGLGKNRLLPGAIARLAEDGYGLLLQIHDFAEDFRSQAYRHVDRPEKLYPQAENVHYAVLNGRDHEILGSSGVAAPRLHLLPNPVPTGVERPPRAEARKRLEEKFGVAPTRPLILYPVRCIRRKNVGEALLYAALAPAGAIVGLTLAPLNPVEVPIYESWKQTAAELELPALFELGAPGGLTFAENLSAADLILTTSLAEGFGMAFLEAWPAGRMLLGRDLPEITVDFTRLGFRFDWLKPRLNVPVEWVGSDEFRQTTEEIYRRTLEAYGRRVPDGLAGQIEARIVDGLVDFGDLDERLQQRVLRTVCRSAADRRRVSECNAWIERALSIRPADASEPIEHNLQAITEHLSAAPSGRRLREVYETVAASPRGGRIERLVGHELILERFLSPARFRPIRV